MIWMILGGAAVLCIVAILIIAVIVYRGMAINTKRDEQIELRTNLPTIWRNTVEEIKEAKLLISTLNTEQIMIKSRDNLKLYGVYIPSNTPTKTTVVCVHGYTTMGMNEFALYVPFYRKLGVNLLIVDCRAHGKSDGKFITFGYYDKLDCIDWCKYLVNRFGDIDIVLHGISMGGTTVTMASGDHQSNVRGIISDSAYTDAWNIIKHVIKRDKKITVFPFLSLISIINTLTCGFGYKKCSALEQVKHAQVPFLFIHGDRDGFVPVNMVYKLYNACPTTKKLVVIKDASHGASFLRERQTVSDAIIGFFNQIGVQTHIE